MIDGISLNCNIVFMKISIQKLRNLSFLACLLMIVPQCTPGSGLMTWSTAGWGSATGPTRSPSPSPGPRRPGELSLVERSGAEL